MSVIRVVRFNADPERVDELVARRSDLIEVIRACCPGLIDTRLGRLDESIWMDQWRWETSEQMEAGMAAAAGNPAAAAAFELVDSPRAEVVEVVEAD